jgi:hypothetical protein
LRDEIDANDSTWLVPIVLSASFGALVGLGTDLVGTSYQLRAARFVFFDLMNAKVIPSPEVAVTRLGRYQSCVKSTNGWSSDEQLGNVALVRLNIEVRRLTPRFEGVGRRRFNGNIGRFLVLQTSDFFLKAKDALSSKWTIVITTYTDALGGRAFAIALIDECRVAESRDELLKTKVSNLNTLDKSWIPIAVVLTCSLVTLFR